MPVLYRVPPVFVTPDDFNTPEAAWFNRYFLFRRNVKLYSQAGAPVGHPVRYTIYNKKVRADYADILVVYAPNVTDPLAQHIIPFSVTPTSDNSQLIIEFQLVDSMSPGETNSGLYYIYHDNPSLFGTPHLITYVPNPWPINVAQDSGIITYTRPGQDWVNGVSYTREALAALHFFGTDIQLISTFRSDQGLAAVKLDSGPWVDVDLYSSQTKVQPAWEAHDLTPDNHVFLLKDVGRNRGQSSGTSVNISSINYFTYIQSIDVGEEVYPAITWATSLGGA